MYFSLSITSGAVNNNIPISNLKLVFINLLVFTHIADSTDSSTNHFSFGNVNGKTQIGYPYVSVIVKKDILRFTVPIDDTLSV